MIDMNEIKLFCKSNKTLGEPINELYRNFSSITLRKSKGIITQYEFEKALDTLEKSVIKHLKVKINNFLQECPNTYEAFIKRHEFISREFWDENTLHRSATEPNFFKKCLGLPAWEEENEARINASTRKSLKCLKYKDLLSKAKKIDAVEAVEKSVYPGNVVVVNKPKSFKESMPIDWDKMTFNQRLEFYRNIKDNPDFKVYVAAKDPKILNFEEKSEKYAKSDRTFGLYVILYSFPANEATKQTKARLKEFVEALNKLGRGRLQYVETVNPSLIEIREVRS